MSDPGRRPGSATPRRRVAVYALTTVVAVVALYQGIALLGPEHPVVSPLAAAEESDFDPLRDEIVCELPEGREGEEREEATALPALPIAVGSEQLYDCPQTWDGRLVRYTGEAVGALLARDIGTWAQLNDDAYGLQGAVLPSHNDLRGGNAGVGVLLQAEAASRIDTVGGPRQHGDVVEVVGVFHRVDETTGEVAVIRAESATIVRRGSPQDTGSSGARPIVALAAAAMAATIALLERRARAQR